MPAPPEAKRRPSDKRRPVPSDESVGAADSSPKFYKGPTVPMDLKKTKENVQAKFERGNQAIKRNAKIAKRNISKARPHTFFTTLVLTLSLLSLFTLQFCPPPSATSSLRTSPFSHYNALSKFEIPKWEHIVCEPTNWYRVNVLDRYIVPRIKERVGQLGENKLVKEYVRPRYIQAEKVVMPLYRKRILPVLYQSFNTGKYLYSKTIAPRIPLIQRNNQFIYKRLQKNLGPYYKDFIDLTSYYIKQTTSSPTYKTVSAQYASTSKVLQPQIESSWKKGGEFGQLVGKHAWIGGERVRKWSVPRIVEGMERGLDLLEQGAEFAWSQARSYYNQLLHPHLHPHLQTVDTAIKPYQPHIQNYLTPLVPILGSLVAAPSYSDVRANIRKLKAPTPAEPKSLKDKFLNTIKGGIDIIATDGQVDEDEQDYDAYFATSLIGKNAGEDGKQRKERLKVEKREKKEVRVEVEETLKELEERVQRVGKEQEVMVQKEITKLVDNHTRSTLSKILQTRISSIQKQSIKIVKAYQKYVNSLDLNSSEKPVQKELRKKVIAAGDKAVEKVDGLWEGFREECEDGLLVKGALEHSEAVIDKAAAKVDAEYLKDHAKLGRKLSWYNGVTSSDWKRFNGITDTAKFWRERFHARQYEALTSARAAQGSAISEVADLLKPYKADIIATEKEAIMKLGGNPSILPIRLPNIESIKDAADMAIGKSKEQIAQAFAQAQNVAGDATPSASGYLEAAQASASSLAASAGSAYHSATSSISAAVGATPSPDSARQHAQSLAAVIAGQASVASASASSLADQAGSAYHSATRSMSVAAGATPSPETYQESAASVLAAASSAYHQATRSASSALGATPSPESLQETVERVIAVASSMGSSILEEATLTAAIVYDGASSAISNPASVVSSAMSDASSAVSSVYNEASFVASSVITAASSSASSLVTEASSTLHDATRSAIKAVGATPSPEGFGEHMESFTEAAKSSASSAAAQVSSSYSSVTRAASKAAGASPTADTWNDVVDDVMESVVAAKESVVSVAAEASSTVSSLANEGTGRVKAAVDRNEL